MYIAGVQKDGPINAPILSQQHQNKTGDAEISEQQVSTCFISDQTPRKSYLQRLTPFSFAHGGWTTFFRHSYQPFTVLFTFPAIAYSALLYGSLIAWLVAVVNVYSIYFTFPPYKFGPSGIGLMNLPPFIGTIIAFLFGGVFSDWLVIRLSRRNNGIFEPEMRLWIALPFLIILPGSILLFGLSTANGLHWIVPCIGTAFYGFGLTALSDVAITYAMDCYKDVSYLF